MHLTASAFAGWALATTGLWAVFPSGESAQSAPPVANERLSTSKSGLRVEHWRLSQIFVEVALEVTVDRMWPRSDQESRWVLPVSKGSGFVGSIGGVRGVVTARHVVDWGRHFLDDDERERRFAADGEVTIEDADGDKHEVDDDVTVRMVRTRIALGPLAVRPTEVWFAPGTDLAFLPIYDERSLKALDLMSVPQDRAPLDPNRPLSLMRGASEITAVGFAAGPMPTAVDGRLVDRARDQLNVIARESTAPPGLSGSPAFHNNRFAGIVINSSANETALRFGVLARESILEACKNASRWERLSISPDPVTTKSAPGGFSRKL